MNADKVSGHGTLKVRFQVTNPERRSFSEKKNTNKANAEGNLKSSMGEQQLLKSTRSEKVSHNYISNSAGGGGQQILKSGRPAKMNRTEQPNHLISNNPIQTTDVSCDIENRVTSK